VLGRVAAVVAAGALCALAPASAGGADNAVEVNANGNVFYDQASLGFTPQSVTASVGQIVRWKNTDPIVPHTATEDHGLWDLGGTYGQTPANPSGFAPGTTVERPFEAGIHHYYCRVHPQQMKGTVSVPVDLTTRSVVHTKQVTKRVKIRRRGRTRFRRVRVTVRTTTVYVVAIWSRGSPADGEAFDVQRSLANGSWQDFATATRAARGEFLYGTPGRTWQVRARLRSAADANKATDWSPPASVLA
jgi:plastocyanin